MSSTRTHVIVGAGPVGTALAERLAKAGDRVRIVTRSGSGPAAEGIERVSADASDAAALAGTCTGADVLYNCANPGSYTRWERAWPPLAASILAAAEATGAVLVTMSNLYAYGPVEAPMTPDTPLNAIDHKGKLRARMWRDALAAHEEGRVRVTEARASDFIGPTARKAGLLGMYASATVRGKTAIIFGDPDQPHSWTAIDDVAATLEVLGADEWAWGAAWHVPTAAPATIRETLTAIGRAAGAGTPRLRRMPHWALSAAGAAVPLLREVKGVVYQFERPFVIDASATTATFGITATDWDDVVADTARAWAAQR